jgi:hypothetical protein
MESARKLIIYSVFVIYDLKILKSIPFCVSNSTCSKLKLRCEKFGFTGIILGPKFYVEINGNPCQKAYFPGTQYRNHARTRKFGFLKYFFKRYI